MGFCLRIQLSLAFLCCMITPSLNVIVIHMDQSASDEMFQIDDRYIGGGINESLSPEYEAKIKGLALYSLDEKCKMGKDLGVGFQLYTPYVDLGFGQNFTTTIVSGMLPHIVKEMTSYCCPDSKVSFGNHFASIRDVEEHFDSEMHIDISFPLYGLDGKDSTLFKDLPFIPLVTAPKIVVLVPDKLFKEKNTRTAVLMSTIFNAWPILIFIVVSAMLAGLIVWVLDKKKNSDEFPPTFFTGAWEGIWWAFVTMTTVGYGDRSPKSIYARAFCIMWILMGVILISLFTGLVSAALTASATPVFNIPGSKIGAVSGSIEFQVGVGLNADMYAYPNHAKLISELTDGKKLHAAIIDNFILSAIRDDLTKHQLRLERELPYPVTYGVALRSNSSVTAACFRKFSRHYPHRIFEIISSKLYAVKNPTDEVSLEVQAAETLFYEEPVFKTLVYTEAGLLTAALLLGCLWELFVRNKNSAAYKLIGALKGKARLQKQSFGLSEVEKSHSNANGIEATSTDFDELVKEYERFHANWMDKVRALNAASSHGDNAGHIFQTKSIL